MCDKTSSWPGSEIKQYRILVGSLNRSFEKFVSVPGEPNRPPTAPRAKDGERGEGFFLESFWFRGSPPPSSVAAVRRSVPVVGLARVDGGRDLRQGSLPLLLNV